MHLKKEIVCKYPKKLIEVKNNEKAKGRKCKTTTRLLIRY